MTRRDRLEVAVRAVRPLLNRVVFTGRHAAALLMKTGEAEEQTPTAFADDARVHALSSMSLDRIATELQRLGLKRGSRTAQSDVWVVDDSVTLDVRFVQTESLDSNLWLEYATLLTVPATFVDGSIAHLTSAPALLALEWAGYQRAGVHPLESSHLEEIVLLIASCPAIEREIASSPLELRRFVAAGSARFLADDSAAHVIRSALPDATRLPEIVRRVVHRMGLIAALG